MGQNKVKSCKACSADSEVQYGGINHGRIFFRESSHEGATEQLPQKQSPVPWSEEQVQVIQRHMGILSLHCKAPAVGCTKVPTDSRVDACGEDRSSDQTEDDNGQAMSRVIELNCQPGLPYGWEQFLDIKTGEIYYIDRNCGKRTSTDPRPIMLDIEKKVNAQINSVKDDGRLVLTLKGCKQCLIYFLIPGEIKECPSCKHVLLKLTN